MGVDGDRNLERLWFFILGLLVGIFASHLLFPIAPVLPASFIR